MDLSDLDRDRLYERTVSRASEVSAAHARRQKLARRIPIIGLVAVLTVSVGLIAAFHGSPTHKTVSPGGGAKTTSTTTTIPSPAPVVSLTPKGWVPVDYGNAQISVPGSWRFSYGAGGGCLLSRPIHTVSINTTAACGDLMMYFGPRIAFDPLNAFKPTSPGRLMDVNGFHAIRYLMGVVGYVYAVPQLGISLWLSDAPASVLDTLTWAPRAEALAGGPAPVVPLSWRRFTAGGISIAVPAAWLPGGHPVPDTGEGPTCWPEYALPGPAEAILDTDKGDPAVVSCSASIPANSGSMPRTDNGLVVDLDSRDPSFWPGGTPGKCLDINGLRSCIVNGEPVRDILFVYVHVPKRAVPLLLEIGLAGTGETARAILYSIRPA